MVPENASVNLNSTTKASAAQASLRTRNSENAPTAAWITRVNAAVGAGRGLRARRLLGLGGGERRDGADQHQRCHHHIAPHPRRGARDAGAFERAHHEQRARGRDQHADAIGRDIGRHAGGLLALGQAFDAKRIDHDVLGRRHRRDQQRAERHEQRRARRIGQRQQQDRADQQQLREHQPAAPAAEGAREERHMQRIDQRRPEKFQRVGRADQREQPDGAEIDAGFAHPHQQRRPRQRQRQAGRKAEQQHDQHAPLQIHRQPSRQEARGAVAFSGEAEAASVRS